MLTKKLQLFVALSLMCIGIGYAEQVEESSSSSSSSSSSKHTPIHVKRDSFGVPHITGGSLKEIFRTIGRVHAEDRLTQIFLTTINANGRLAEFLGPGPSNLFVQSDVFQREINYTDAEVQKQFKHCFTKKTKLVITEFVNGINDRVDEVNADFSKMPYELKLLGFNPGNPLPHFTLFDVIRANQFFLQSFSPSSIPMFQLTNLADIVTLIANAGGNTVQAFEIFADVDPTTDLISSQSTILPGELECSCEGSLTEGSKHRSDIKAERDDRLIGHTKDLAEIAVRLHGVKKVSERFSPRWGSNGEAISRSKSLSGNAMLRCAIQPNFNHPSDFYQVIVDSKEAHFHADILSPAIAPLAVGVYQQHGVTVQTGALFSNDFLIESINNATQERIEVIKIRGFPDLVIPVFRSKSGGWVIQIPLASDPTMMLTLRSVFLGKQLRSFNSIVEQAFTTSFGGFKNTFLNPDFQSDISLFEGQYADTAGNIATFHTGGWTKLPAKFDRRFPQGVPFNPAPSNDEYSFDKIARGPLFDSNGDEGFYVGWNTTWNNKIPASNDVSTGIGLSRVYWIRNFLEKHKKLSFDDLEHLSFVQAVANSLSAFANDRPVENADFFTPLFKKRFFEAVKAHPTKERERALRLLANFQGRWFDGNRAEVAATTDVSDKFILASLWLTCVMEEILNPFLTGTTRQICSAANPCTPLPSKSSPSLAYATNLLARILKTNCDNRVFFPGWLAGQPNVDKVIVQCLDQAISILGGFKARPWGVGKRGIYAFNNPILSPPPVGLGPVATMGMFNASGVYFIAEFTKCNGVRMKSIIPLGESGEVLGTPPAAPVFAPHNFDQQPIFTQFKLRDLPRVKCGK